MPIAKSNATMRLAGDPAQVKPDVPQPPLRMTRRRSVIFRHAFTLPCFSDTQPAGTYEISTIDEEVGDAALKAWLRLSTLICTPCIELQTGPQHWTSTSSTDLDAALKRDGQGQPRGFAAR